MKRYLFENAHKELIKKFDKNKNEICSICDGFGTVEFIGMRRFDIKCETCNGRGIIEKDKK